MGSEQKFSFYSDPKYHSVLQAVKPQTFAARPVVLKGPFFTGEADCAKNGKALIGIDKLTANIG